MKKLLIAVGCCLYMFAIQAQTPERLNSFNFDADLAYAADIPSPETALGYAPGDEFTVYAHVVDYFKQLAAASPRVMINEYGRTYENKPLLNVVISSEKNMARIE